MAKINGAFHGVGAQESFMTLATLGLMCCMVLTLVGIKIWWFKHRLTFDQSSSSNGAAGGSQPRVVTRSSRSTKDKRLSQQFREPVLVHGVFRKRAEDELEPIERPKLLPPIRQRKISQSTPALFHPPKPRQLEQGSDLLKIPAPPKREAPVPPRRDTATTDSQVLPATPSQFFNVVSKPQSKPAQRDTQIKTEHSDSFSEEEFYSEEPKYKADEDTLSKPPKPLKRNRSSNLEAVERNFIREKSGFQKEGKINLAERRATGFLKPSEEDWQHFHDEDEHDHATNCAMETHSERGESLDINLKEGKLRKWEGLENYGDEIIDFKQEEINNPHFFVRNMQFGVEEVEPAKNQNLTRWTKQRRPTGYVRNVSEIQTELAEEIEKDFKTEARYQHNSDEHDKLWQEMERDIDEDFASNIEEEFNKIRHTYEANEEGFLEERANDLAGYGKSIDENWNNFERLSNDEAYNEHAENNKIERRPTGFIRDEGLTTSEGKLRVEAPANNDGKLTAEGLAKSNVSTTDELEQKVRFQFDDFEEQRHNEENENRSTLITHRRATGYVSDTKEITAQLNEAEIKSNEMRELIDSPTKVSFQLDDSEDDAQIAQGTSKIKQRRPTAFVRREEHKSIVFDSDDEAEEETSEEPNTRKPKPRQKVTFQFQPEVRELLADEDEETEDQVYKVQPQPMQRMTKLRYSYNDDPEAFPSATRTENRAALLFSTQVSAEYAAQATEEEGFNDSWSAIRKHRHLTEEFQQITLDDDVKADAMKSATPTPITVLYRNPLAKMAAAGGNQEANEQEFYSAVKPRTMRDMKKAQTRQTVYDNLYGESTTEV